MDTSIQATTRLEAFKEWLPKVNEIRNYTPHSVRLDFGDTGVTCEPYGAPLRIDEEFKPIGKYNDTPIVNKIMGDLALPVFKQGVLNIVSLPVAQRIAQEQPTRVDFVTPGELIRNDEGVITGCKNLAFIE